MSFNFLEFSELIAVLTAYCKAFFYFMCTYSGFGIYTKFHASVG